MRNPDAPPASGLAASFLKPQRLVLLGLNILLYVFLIRWVIHNIDFALLVQSVERIPLWALLVSFLLNFLALVLYGVRMQLFLRRNFSVAFAVVNIGYAYGTIMPFRLGDALKVYSCCRLFAMRVSEVVAATVAEKIVDLCKLLLIGGIVASLTASSIIHLGTLLPLAAVIVAGVAALLLARIFLVRLIRMLPKKGALRRGVVGLFRHSSQYQFGRIWLVTLAIWTANIVLFYVAFNTYLPNVSVDLLGAMAMLVITALTIALPSAPAGIGLFEAGIVAYLSQFRHVPYEQALAAATVFHVVVTVPQIFIALGWVAYLKKNPHLAARPADPAARAMAR